MCWGPGTVLSPPRICCDSVGSTFSHAVSCPSLELVSLSERMAGVRDEAVENLVSSLEKVALSDVGAGLLRLSATLSCLRARCCPLDLSLQSTAVLRKPPLFLYLLLEC